MGSDNLDEPHERLRWARKRAGFETAKDFARKAKISEVTYRAYENGQVGFAKHTTNFARLLGISTDWLSEGGPVPDGADTHLQRQRVAGEASDLLDIQMVRQVDISYAMGDGAVVADYPDTGLMPFERNFLRTLEVADASKAFVCRGVGDSMAPTIHNGDIVLVDARRNRVTMQDQIWALVVAGAGMIKRVRPLPNGQVMVLSDNPLVPEQTYDADDVYIVGKVVWIGRMM